MSPDRRHRQGHRVAVRINNVGDTLTPRHGRGFAEHSHTFDTERLDRPVDIVDVNEHLEANAFARGEPVLLFGPLAGDDRDLVLGAAKSDVAWIAVLRKLKVPLEPKCLIKGRRARDAHGEDDGKGTTDDRLRIRHALGQRRQMSLEVRLLQLCDGGLDAGE